MDALAQLALMTKAKLLFETADTFLSFPALTPISYSPDNLNFVNATTPGEWAAFADFSTWANALPQGTVFQPSLDTMLWDLYLGILQNAQVATGALTTDQAAQLAAAQAYVSQEGPDGLLEDTPEMTAYRQYQQAYFVAVQDYNNQNVTATMSADPAVVAAWKNGGQAAATAEVEAAESDWENKGYKAAVEQALQTEKTLGALSPQLKWSQWTAQCNPAIDFPTNPGSGAQFGATLFEPFDVATAATWPSFSIAGADIPNLVGQAPAELAGIFGGTTGTSEIVSIAFEYCSVAVSRSWFSSQLFTSRFWKFSDPTLQLSDGNDPPAGEWPAYVTAVVLARNIVITSKDAATTTQPLRTFPVLPVGVLHLTPTPSPKPLPIIFRTKFPVRSNTAVNVSGATAQPSSSTPHPVMTANAVMV